MRKIFVLFSVAVAMIVGCDRYDHTPIWDKLNEHEDRIEKLEQLCGRLNTNIESLQTIIDALQQNDYVTNVVAIMENGKEVGYTIYFSISGPVTIYHGQDGKDGADGKDGTDGQDGADGQDGVTPIIGVKQGDDGRYYWTLNGEWLLDDDGNMIPAVGQDGADGSPGADGSDGAPGAPGQDGVTPQMKIEEGYWYISYDNGANWIKLGKATGEDGKDGADGEDGEDGQDGAPGTPGEDGKPGADGADGKDGADGDSMFQNVEVTSSYVIITLTDGTVFKIPTWKAFEDLQTTVDQLNSNVASLQTIVQALQNNDYVISVVPLYENGKEVGYTITFSKSGTATIYHGKDGQDGKPGADGTNGNDGADGQDGKTPVISVRKDSDGKYYWTLDGDWLLDANGNKVPTTGADGKDGEDGEDGEDGVDGQPGAPGQDGKPGADGQDGITPMFEIRDGYWYISYDNGSTWTKRGKATGADGKDGADGEDGTDGSDGAPGQDGKPGSDGQDGDSFFQGVDTTNADYVVITLADGTQIKLPTWAAFEALQERCNQINGNLQALQTIVDALQNKDFIVDVTPVYDGVKEIGYIITFSKGGKITIYHGADGEDGYNGTAPNMGVRKDEDGNYYWTLNGEWLLDADGQKVKASGEDGAAGQPGATPEFKITDGNWYVSYGDGWMYVGPATGETGPQGPQGSQGAQGPQGDSMFQDVQYDDTSMTFILADGTEIIIPLSANGVSVYLSNVDEFSARFAGTVAKKGVDFKVTVYYSTNSNISLYNYFNCVKVTSTTGNSFALLVDKLYSDTMYYYFIETVNNGKVSYTEPDSFRTGVVTGYDREFDITEYVDLAIPGSANSYIVTEPGTYRIPAVKGNGTASVGSVSCVDVLWESFGTSLVPSRGDLVKGAKYEDGYVYFKTNATYKEGNAVIAAKSSSGTVLWSWHIWMTDQPKEQVYYRNAGTMMDRNLGATSANPGDVGALGLMYQWGRKDPFMGSSSISSVVEARSTITFPTVINSTSTTGTVEWATKNPTTMIAGSANNRWMYTVDNTLWASSKTIYDPCPAGWRVPEAGENGVWVKAAGRNGFSTNPFDKVNKGVDMSGLIGSDECIWYPATGYYGKANGVFYGVGSHATYMSCSLASYGYQCMVLDSNDSDMYLLYLSDFGGADPVRCLKE